MSSGYFFPCMFHVGDSCVSCLVKGDKDPVHLYVEKCCLSSCAKGGSLCGSEVCLVSGVCMGNLLSSGTAVFSVPVFPLTGF